MPPKFTSGPCLIDGCDRSVHCRGYCRLHYDQLRRGESVVSVGPKRIVGDDVTRFFSKVDASGDCWAWTAGTMAGGYGNFSVGYKAVLAHRWCWEHLVGPIPEGMEMDHLCRNRRCVNPDHLQPVPGIVNNRRGYGMGVRNARKTHCINGHELTPDNVATRDGRWRVCIECYRQRMKESAARRTAIRKARSDTQPERKP